MKCMDCNSYPPEQPGRGDCVTRGLFVYGKTEHRPCWRPRGEVLLQAAAPNLLALARQVARMTTWEESPCPVCGLTDWRTAGGHYCHIISDDSRETLDALIAQARKLTEGL